MAPGTEQHGGDEVFGRKERRSHRVGRRDMMGKEAEGAKTGLSKLGMRSRGTNTRGGRDRDLLIIAALHIHLAWRLQQQTPLH